MSESQEARRAENERRAEAIRLLDRLEREIEADKRPAPEPVDWILLALTVAALLVAAALVFRWLL